MKTPKTRARTTTILEAISSFDVVNIKERRPVTTAPNKKRKQPKILQKLLDVVLSLDIFSIFLPLLLMSCINMRSSKVITL